MAPLDSQSTVGDLMACAKLGSCSLNITDTNCHATDVDGQDVKAVGEACAARNANVCSSSKAYAFHGKSITRGEYNSLQGQINAFKATPTQGLNQGQLQEVLKEKMTDAELQQECMPQVMKYGLCQSSLTTAPCAYQAPIPFTAQSSTNTLTFELDGRRSLSCSTKDPSELMGKACKPTHSNG